MGLRGSDAAPKLAQPSLEWQVSHELEMTSTASDEPKEIQNPMWKPKPAVEVDVKVEGIEAS